MVRIKHRYMLVNILYPELDNRPVDPNIPDVVAFNQPTTDDLTVNDLLKGIKAEIADTFGEYGSGAVGGSILVKYWSPATSTFILRVSRDHYRIAWAALSMMNRVPLRKGSGRNCVFRVVRVSGTIRKSQEEAVRRAREMILKARREMEERGDSILDGIFGKGGDKAEADSTNDVLVVDKSDTEEEDEISDDDG